MSDTMKVLIAYDGSREADAALEDLPRAGLPRVAEALIMSVVDVFLPPPSLSASAVPAPVPTAVQRAWAQTAHALAEARALALHARAHVLTAFPAWDVRAEACAPRATTESGVGDGGGAGVACSAPFWRRKSTRRPSAVGEACSPVGGGGGSGGALPKTPGQKCRLNFLSALPEVA